MRAAISVRHTSALIGGVAIAALAGQASAADLAVTSWGGAYQDAQRAVYFEPFMKESGKELIEDVWNGGVGSIRAKVEAGGPAEWDVVQVEAEELVLGCEEALYELIDWEALGGQDQFIDAAVDDCGVGTIVWSTVLAYDNAAVDQPPTSWADFWDTETWPGPRALRRGPKYTLEFALIADGVPTSEVYDLLATEEGVDRAFAKLDEIKDDLIWWEAGAQPPQLLAAGEVVMTSAYNGRISSANDEGEDFGIVWDGSIYAVDSWVILSNSVNKETALEFIAFASAPENQKELPKSIAYGVTNKAAADQIEPAILANLPTAPENLEVALELDTEFWVENIEPLTERFTAWLAE
jgi:putative spermidine/putrescine transport system substrate-binding protein